MPLPQFFSTFIVTFLILFLSPTTFAATQTVNSGGSIQQVINSAASGDTISINAGTYKEQIDIKKPLTLTGNGQVWIDGDCSKKYGIQITSSGVSIKNLGIKKVIEQAVIIRNTSSSNITIEGNTIQDYNCQDKGDQNAAGVASWYGGSSIKVLNNKITRRVEVPGNLQGKGNGIWFKSNNQNPSGGGHTISGNIINGGYDGIGGEEEGSDHGSYDKNTTIQNNDIKNCWDDGVQVEGGDVNITVKNNRIEGCGSGVAFAPNRIGPLYIEGNTIIGDLNRRGFYKTVNCFKLGKGGSGITYVTGNICTIPGSSNGGNGFAQTNKGLSPVVSRKNSIQVSRYVVEFTSTVPAGTSFDGDCFTTSDTGRFVKWGNPRYDNFASFQSGTGMEKNGRSSNCATVVTTSTTTSPPATTTPTPSATPQATSSTPKPIASAKVSPSPSLKPSIKPSPTAQSSIENINNKVELQKKIEDLEKQVTQAKQKQNTLESLLSRFIGLFKSWF